MKARLAAWALVLCLALLFLGCGGRSGTGDVSGVDPVETAVTDSGSQDVVEVQPDLPLEDLGCTEPPKLDFVLETGDDDKPCKGQTVCEIYLCPGEERELEVVLTQCGSPVWGAWLTYDIQNDPKSLAKLEYGMAYTDSDGVGSRSLGLADKALGQFQVHICEYGVPETDCIDFNVKHLPCGDTVPLVVGFQDYSGAYPLIDNARVYLTRWSDNIKPLCDSLKYDKLPPVTVISPSVGITQTAQFPLLPNLQAEKVQNYTIVGLAQAGQGPVQAWGCEDGTNPGKPTQVQWGEHTYVELELQDILPEQ
ncbi:MAG: hypothetical protein ISR64_01195 [Deltaproteobacteria bacterium]|nr:hypothetical protein [Deltaproteobacteria bacterium]